MEVWEALRDRRPQLLPGRRSFTEQGPREGEHWAHVDPDEVLDGGGGRQDGSLQEQLPLEGCSVERPVA